MIAPSWDNRTDQYFWPVHNPTDPEWPGKVILTEDGRVQLVGIPNPLPATMLDDVVHALTAAAAWKDHHS